MAMSDLIPWGRGNRNLPAPRRTEEPSPFLSLHREMNRLFDDFFRGFEPGLMPTARFGFANGGGGWPHIEVAETDQEVRVTAELPGLEEKDIEVTLQEGVLTLKGEKRAESDGALYSERWHGRFQRSVQLGPDVDPDKVSASFRNGVLTIAVPKRPEAQRQVRRIPVNG